jgi:membrane protein
MALLFTKSLARRLLTDNISFLAGGVAFYALLALFPSMAALVSLFGLFTDAAVLREQLDASRAFFPPEVYNILVEQMTALGAKSDTTLSIAAVISIVIALYSATRGTKAMLSALNMVFRVRETRAWWLRQSLAFFITIGGIMTLILAVVLIVAIPFALALLPPDLAPLVVKPVQIMRWLILGGSILIGLIILFAFGPNRRVKDQRLLFIVSGAVTATIIWMVAAVVGSWFVQQVPQFHAAYGSLSAVIVLMLWMVVSAYAVLFGGAVTATLDQHYSHIIEDGDDADDFSKDSLPKSRE